MNDKQRRFCDEYLIDLNATQAAIRAGYSPKTAYSKGQQLLKIVEIQTEIQARQSAREKRTEITQDRVVRELAAIAFAKTTDYTRVGDSGVEIRPTDTLKEDEARAIASIEQGRYGVRLKLYDKLRALEILGRHLGMFAGEDSDGQIILVHQVPREDADG